MTTSPPPPAAPAADDGRGFATKFIIAFAIIEAVGIAAALFLR
jgi:hypothetical protein